MGTEDIKASRMDKNTHLSDLIQLGTHWHTYVEATTYDVIEFLMKDTGDITKPEQFRQTLLDVWDSFQKASDSTNPCKERSFRTFSEINDSAKLKMADAELLEARWNASLVTEYDMYVTKGKDRMNEFDYNLPVPSKVCGQINSVFVVPAVYDYILYAYSWHIVAETSFKINITITEMSVSYYPLCTTMYSAISDINTDGSFALLSIHCPNYPVRSYYSSGHIARVALFMPESFLYHHLVSMVQDDSFGDFTFLYQIQDNDFSIESEMFWQILKVTDLKIASHLQELLWQDTNTSGASGVLHNHMPFGSEHKIWLKPVWEVSIFEKVSIGMLYFQAPLGDTVSITYRRLICSSGLHSLRFYDGPAIDMLKTDIIQRLLMLWECKPNKALDASTNYSSVHASIGDLTIIRISHTATNNGNIDMLQFGLRWTLIPVTDGLLNLDMIQIEETKSSSKRFSAEGRALFLGVTVVSAPRPLSVKIGVEAMQYRGRALQQCQSGGLFLFSDGQYIGGICSGTTAKYLLDHYAQRGIILGSKIHIIIKQYFYISEIWANLTFSADTCVGYLNLLPTNRFALGKLYKLTGINVRRSRMYYDSPYYHPLSPAYDQDMNMWHTLHITRISPYCVTIQIGLLDHLPSDLYNQQQDELMTMFHFSSFEKVRYSKVSFSLLSRGDISKFRHCKRLFFVGLDTERERTVLSVIRPNSTATTESWQGEAYNIKVGIPNECLRFYMLFVIHSEDTSSRSTCVSEVGGFLYDVNYPVLLPGICGDVNLTSWVPRTKRLPQVKFSFHKPFPHQSCCYFDVSVRPDVTGCSNFIDVRTRFPEARRKYSVGIWDLKNRSLYHVNGPFDSPAAEFFAFQVDCQVVLPYDSMAKSGVETCVEVHIYLDSFPCKEVKVQFHARHFRLHQQSSMRYDGDQKEVCIGSSCYVTPSILQSLSWVEADLACQQRGGSLVSINSEQEWNILTRPHTAENMSTSLVQALPAQLYYIGLTVKVINSFTSRTFFKCRVHYFCNLGMPVLISLN